MNIRLLLICLFFVPSTILFSQNAILKGRVQDESTGESIAFMTVFSEESKQFAQTDLDGNYTLELPAGNHRIIFSSLEYGKTNEMITLSAGETRILDKKIPSAFNELGVVVKTESKFEKPIENVTVSMEVLKPQLVQNKNTVSAENVLQQIPGVMIVDAEPQIRSGSGYSFGAGSRVMVLMDDMPLLSGDAGRPTWSYLPIENLEQIEVIKGASSVLYGSAALNGVIHFRTAFPKDEPVTKITTFYGIYDMPEQGNWTPHNPPMQGGINFLHSRKIKQFDLVVGGNLFGERSFTGPAALTPGQPLDSLPPGSYNNRFRMNFNTRYRFKKTPGLSIGLNGNAMYGQSAGAFIWGNDSTGIFRSFPGTVTTTLQTTFNIDPYVSYIGKKGSHYSLRTRYYYLDNENNNNQGNSSQVIFGEFQYQKTFRDPKDIDKRFLRNFLITTGLMVSQVYGQAELYSGQSDGSNSQTNVAGYFQLENRFWNRLTLNMGVRYEFFKLGDITGGQPVFRGGFNVQAAKFTFIRGSFGQGYRFPTIAERFIQTKVGPATIFPNPNIQEETSWSAEIGIKQGFKIGQNFKGFLDVAGYWQQYENYVEFTAGAFGPGFFPDNFGFMSINTGPARIVGIDVSVFAGGKITRDFGINILAGYNYSLPQSLNPRFEYATDSLGTKKSYYTTSSIVNTDGDTNATILKYRFRHVAKLDIEFTYKWFNLGMSFRYNSYMENIDQAFYDLETAGVLSAGLSNFRSTHNKGDYIFDMRFGAQVNKIVKVSLIVNNIANRIYSLRPLYVEAPRSFTVQCALQF